VLNQKERSVMFPSAFAHSEVRTCASQWIMKNGVVPPLEEPTP